LELSVDANTNLSQASLQDGFRKASEAKAVYNLGTPLRSKYEPTLAPDDRKLIENSGTQSE
jgi:hypothetical protein